MTTIIDLSPAIAKAREIKRLSDQILEAKRALNRMVPELAAAQLAKSEIESDEHDVLTVFQEKRIWDEVDRALEHAFENVARMYGDKVTKSASGLD